MTSRPQWTFTRRVLVRMAGFAVSRLLELQSPKAVQWVRDILALEENLQEQRSGHLRELLNQRRSGGDRRMLTATNRAIHLVRRFRPVPAGALASGWAAHLDTWNEIASERERLLAMASAGWATELERLEKALRHTASLPELQEAIFLNSPSALSGIRRFASGHKLAPARRLAIRYLQRFCVKNETGGFYGPINYGQFDGHQTEGVLYSQKGDGRAAQRHTLLSYWAAQSIASSWAKDERLAGLLRAYRAARDDAGTGPPPDARLMALANGSHTLESMARQLDLPLESLHATVAEAQSRGWLRLGIRIPASSGDPLEALRLLVAGSTVAHGEKLLEQLTRIACLLSDFQKGTLAERERLLAVGDKILKGVTGEEPSRRKGVFYADRFWYTEEAVGNLGRVTFGRFFATQLASSLTPALEILASSAVDERQAQQDMVRHLLASAGGVIPAARLVDVPVPGPGTQPAIWASLQTAGRPRVELGPEGLAELGLIRGDLDEWPLFCAPDVMIIARDREQLSQGDWEVVLAEAHHICPPTQLPFAAFDPESSAVRAEVRGAVESLAGTARPVLQGVERQNKARDYTPAGHGMLWLDWQANEPGAGSVRIGECTVQLNSDGRPALRRGDGSPLALFPEHEDARPDVGMLRAVALPGIDKQPFRVSVMTPRVTIGRVVYQRQRWDLAAGDLPGRQAPAGSFEEYLAVWRWKTAWKMPDQLFAQVPGEEKPLFLDFCSPLSVDSFLRSIAGCDRLGLEEMLPGFDGLWLEVGGERYCCELRLTAFREDRGGITVTGEGPGGCRHEGPVPSKDA